MRTTPMKEDPISYEEALRVARLAGRHDKPMMLEYALEAGDLDGDQIITARAAFRAGQEARAAGIPCLCIDCQIGTPKLLGNEEKRAAYSERRWKELQAEGKTFDEIRSIIDDEIGRGAAL